MLAPAIEGLRGQPALGQEDFSAAQAKRADGAGALSAACAGPPVAPELVGLPSLHNECLRALTTKPKKLAGYGLQRKCADV